MTNYLKQYQITEEQNVLLERYNIDSYIINRKYDYDKEIYYYNDFEEYEWIIKYVKALEIMNYIKYEKLDIDISDEISFFYGRGSIDEEPFVNGMLEINRVHNII